MRLLDDNILYEFKVEQGGSRNADHGDPFYNHQSDLGLDFDSDYDDYDSSPAFRIVIRYRKFQAPIRRPVAATEQSVDLSLDAINRGSAMSRILLQFEIPSRIGEQMAEHFVFFTERLARRIVSGGKIPVSVRLDVKALSPETAGGIRSRMESAREADAVAPRRRREEAEEELVPARRSAIEALEKVRVGEEGRECVICLEELRVGAEAARMPCGHVYHCNCIVEWLQRTHFCPFCRFQMPC